MTNVEDVDIQGFKGLRQTQLDFKQVNLITGRNNTGKTSVLEAIELGLNPEYLSTFGSNAGKLINIRVDQAMVSLNTPKVQTHYSIESPEPEQALSYAIEALVKIYENQNIMFHHDENMEVFNEAIVASIRNVLNGLEASEIKALEDDILILEYNGGHYPYVALSESLISELIMEREDELKETLSSELEERLEDPDDHPQLWNAVEYLPLRHWGGPGVFLDTPVGPNETIVIQQPIMESPPDSSEEDDTAIKKVEIRDYLNDHNITPELGVTVEDFDFDVLVFEEEGDRYQVPYSFMGDGFKTIVGILWEFVGEDKMHDVVLMEEPENHMHPGYIGELVPFLSEVARDEDIQLFITTHNIDFISEFLDEAPESMEKFLKEEFNLIQMTETIPKIFDYKDAKEQVKELKLDLRGI